MTEEEALTWAIFCLNTHMAPESSDDDAVAELDEKADEALVVLDKMRASLRGDPPTGKHHRK